MPATWRPSFKLYDRLGQYVRELSGMTYALWTQGVDGTDTLELRGPHAIGKDDRVVWCDWTGSWHEHMATAPSARRDGAGGPEWRTQLKTSLCELSRCRPADDEYRPRTALAAAQHAVAGTRWDVGIVDSTGDGTMCELYRISCLGCVTAAAETFGLEPYASYTVGDAGVVTRTLNMHRRGRDGGRRFEYGRDLASVKAEYSTADVVTALRGLGKGEPTADGHGRRITFASVNGGVDYVEDVEATAIWGMPGPGGMMPAFADVVFEGVADPQELLELTRAELRRRSSPQVSYEMDVVGAAGGGLDALDVAVGDVVEVVDQTFQPALHVSARLVEARWVLMSLGMSSFVLGTPRYGATDLWAGLAETAARTSALSEESAAWEDSSGASSGYLRRVMAGISALCNAGLSYTVESETLGIMCANVPLDPQTGAPLAASSSGYRCLNLRAGILRISSEYANGQWVWTTAATGTGIVADVIATGTLSADRIAAKSITGAKMADGTVGATQIADAAITNAKIDSLSASKITAGTLSADRIAAKSITGAKMADGTVGATQIADAAITNAKIDSLSASKITAGTLSVERLAAKSITTEKINDAAVTGAKLGSSAVTTEKIADAAITNAKIDSLSASKIRTGVITAENDRLSINLNDGTITASRTLGESRIGFELATYSGTSKVFTVTMNDYNLSFMCGTKEVASIGAIVPVSAYSDTYGKLNINGDATIKRYFRVGKDYYQGSGLSSDPPITPQGTMLIQADISSNTLMLGNTYNTAGTHHDDWDVDSKTRIYVYGEKMVVYGSLRIAGTLYATSGTSYPGVDNTISFRDMNNTTHRLGVKNGIVVELS